MSQSEKPPLDGLSVGLPETRESESLSRLFEEKGARVICCPLISILDSPDVPAVEAFLRRMIDGSFDDIILMTGEGVRRLRGFAERAGLKNEFVEALGKLRRLVRGPKPLRALRELGLDAELQADPPTTDGVISTLQRVDLSGRRVAVQLYSRSPPAKLTSFLVKAGASVTTVAPYVYASATDEDRVVEFIDAIGAGKIDVLAFTSASQVDRLFEVALERGRVESLEHGLARTRVAAIGPVVEEALTSRNVRVWIRPENAYFMRPLVHAVVAGIVRDSMEDTLH